MIEAENVRLEPCRNVTVVCKRLWPVAEADCSTRALQPQDAADLMMMINASIT